MVIEFIIWLVILSFVGLIFIFWFSIGKLGLWILLGYSNVCIIIIFCLLKFLMCNVVSLVLLCSVKCMIVIWLVLVSVLVSSIYDFDDFELGFKK